ncbi:hypothetical protein ENSA5_28950 [Enhygromyxa salina]|uniref:Uncharacterized protein n=1 Tax=Enhygromyxa salina TaxID=215803 RepID=A0A2S9Y2S3_9BACT|nr:hypothetical protein [Enhygromyxa salina]PRP99386.1 hypothetical protein ENSA5_28950 [Enhygromyxa salina]
MLHPLNQPPSSLFWSAPVDRDTDFTAEDPLALDYLGQQVGNWLFPGFTTRTGRAQYYLVVLYGLHLVERAIQRHGYPGDDQTRTRLFERWERLWALATLESRHGELTRGDVDAMRGVRGAKRTWTSGTKPLPLDFILISRQNELAGLGAYLSSLRHYRLVVDHTLRPSRAARELIDDFWSESGPRGRSQSYTRYALAALNLERTSISRKSGHVTLELLGKKSRLSAIRHRRRQATREQLWQLLFEGARDPTTLALALQIEAADRAGVQDPATLLEGMARGDWGELDLSVHEHVSLALAFGKLAVALLDHFDRCYQAVHEAGWIADAEAVAGLVFSRPETDLLRIRCAALLEHPLRSRFRELRFHGRPLLKLCGQLASSDPVTCLAALLGFHRQVQRSRRGGGAWIRQADTKLTLQVTHYRGYRSYAQLPSFKLWTVRSLLRDLGRIA